VWLLSYISLDQTDRARHLLHELSVPSFVSNNTYIVGGHENDIEGARSDDRISSNSGVLFSDMETVASRSSSGEQGPSILVMTGPNYSGKSVYLKQIALITYMAHIGRYLLQAPG
jgi:DNA mismatch repair protein MSH5